MKLSKICLLLIIITLTIGFVSAVDINEFKAPSNFESDGNCSFYELNSLNLVDENGISIEIYTDESMKETAETLGIDEDDSDYSSFFKNDTSLNYTVESSDDENIFSFYDGTNEIKGYVELVKVGDEEVCIESEIDSNASDDKLKQSLDVLKEFNKLNNLKPLNPILED